MDHCILMHAMDGMVLDLEPHRIWAGSITITKSPSTTTTTTTTLWTTLRQSRILEIEWAVNEGREFVPSPKTTRKRRDRGARRGKRASSIGFSGDIGDVSTVEPAVTFPQPNAVPATIQEEDEDEENQSDASIVSSISLKSTKKGSKRRGFFGKGSFLAPIFEKDSAKEFGGERTNVELPASKLPVASGLKRNDREEAVKDTSTHEAPIKRVRV